LHSRIHARMSNSINSAKRATAGITRKHSRLSIFAASAATAGVLGAAGFAVGSAPWSQAAGDAAKTVHSGSQSTSGQSGALTFDAMTGAKAAQLDSLRSAATGGTDVGATAAHVSGSAAHVSGSAAHHVAHLAVDHPKPAAAKKAYAKPAPARHAAKKAAPKPKAKPKPYQIYDSVTPSSIPAGKAAAVYTNGAYAASAHQVAGHKSVLWIDTNGSNPGANVLDVEPGDATPAGAAAWVQQRLVKHPDSVAIVYTMRSSWQQVKNHVAHLPRSMQDNVKYWIADPTGVDHTVPGADATQWYWGAHIDISTASPALTQEG
jgi:hypothetical protein